MREDRYCCECEEEMNNYNMGVANHADERLIARPEGNMLDIERLKKYIQNVKSTQSVVFGMMTDEEILEQNFVKKGNLYTLAGLLVFSHYPQRYLRQYGIIAVVVPGMSLGDEIDGVKFLDNQRINGSIEEMLNGALNFVQRNSRRQDQITYGGQMGSSDYPLKAIREAILNALVHRDYSMASNGAPIQLYMYRDRLEIRNPCFPTLKGDREVKGLSYFPVNTRNFALANILESLNIIDNRYSGIATMKKYLKKAGLGAPDFKLVHGDFVVTIRNELNFSHLNYSDKKNRKMIKKERKGKNLSTDTIKNIQEFCKQARTREEIADFMGGNKNTIRARIIVPFLKKGILRMTIPDKVNSPYQKYVTV